MYIKLDRNTTAHMGAARIFYMNIIGFMNNEVNHLDRMAHNETKLFDAIHRTMRVCILK